MEMDNENILEKFTPFEIDPITKKRVSPEHLPEYLGMSALAEIDQAYDTLEVALKPEEVYRAISILIFHARHLSAVEHALIAEFISKPYKRSRGGQLKPKMNIAAEEFVHLMSLKIFNQSSTEKDQRKKRRYEKSNIAKEFQISKPFAGKLLVKAEKKIKADKNNGT
jgi:hypothetical protein